MKTLAAAALIFITTPACAGEWHLMTQSYGGTVSLLHGLERDTCEFARNRSLGQPATDDEREAERRRYIAANPVCPASDAGKEEWKTWQTEHPGATGCRWREGNGGASWGVGRMISPGDIKSAECFR